VKNYEEVQKVDHFCFWCCNKIKVSGELQLVKTNENEVNFCFGFGENVCGVLTYSLRV